MTSPSEVQFNPRNDLHRSRNIESVLFEPLAAYDPVSDSFVPVLADGWTFSKEGYELDITLREDYRWHEVSYEGATATRRDTR